MRYDELYEEEEDVYGLDDFEIEDEEDEDFLTADDTSETEDAFLEDVVEVDSLSKWYADFISNKI